MLSLMMHAISFTTSTIDTRFKSHADYRPKLILKIEEADDTGTVQSKRF